MNKCKLEIFFRFIEFNNEYMGVKIRYNNAESTLTPTDDLVYCYEQEIILPCIIDLEFFGKTNGKDTKIDEHGTVLKDKHVLIKAIKLDNLPVEPLYLKRRLELKYDHGSNCSNYIGFNGHMQINFEKSNVFNQLLHMKRLGEY